MILHRNWWLVEQSKQSISSAKHENEPNLEKEWEETIDRAKGTHGDC